MVSSSKGVYSRRKDALTAKVDDGDNLERQPQLTLMNSSNRTTRAANRLRKLGNAPYDDCTSAAGQS